MTVELHDITVRFGDVVALDGVSFVADQGKIHALVGENGAGKTTLMRVLYGAVVPDAGTIHVAGSRVSFRNSGEAIAAGIGMVSQHYSVIPELTCLENLILGAEPGWALHRGATIQRARELAAKMGYEFDWAASADRLGPAGSQKLEILKLLWRGSRTMILDEPTAMLSPADSEGLFQSLRSLADQGATVIVVTHRLPEVLQHCEQVTVLRGGKQVGAQPVKNLEAASLAELIVGQQVQARNHGSAIPGEPVLEVVGLRAKGYRGDWAVDGADLTLHEGEMVGLAGVDGNGQRELFHALVGTLPSEGTIRFRDEDWSGQGTARRIADGLRLVPEDRHEEGAVDSWSLVENSILGLQRCPGPARAAWLDRTQATAIAQRVTERFATRHGGLDYPISSLSGGNQQRFVAARALEMSPKLVLAFQPSRGLDIRGSEDVFAAIRSECRAGATALIASFDLDELLSQCDRVVVMSRGKIVAPPRGAEMDRSAIGKLMTEVE
ncbi:MAG: ABC transporter ATP-binding protein [Fimbriimonadaceae bacterium]|nr:ABC transporter ATP-binding protein [Fimbriimonadaceae bacterium]